MTLPTTLPAGVIPAIGVGVLAVAGAAAAAAPVLHTSGRYAFTAAGVFVAMMAIAVRRIRLHHPFPRFGPANKVTTARAAIVALVAALVGEAPGASVAAAAVAAAALCALLDGVDGKLARRSGTASGFGARFDLEIDALLILLLSMLVWHHGKAGPWVLLCGLMRYAFVAAGWFLPWLAQPLRSTLRGKTVAVAQMAGLALALLPPVRTPVSTVVAALTLAALVWSFAVDVAWLARQYRR